MFTVFWPLIAAIAIPMIALEELNVRNGFQSTKDAIFSAYDNFFESVL